MQRIFRPLSARALLLLRLLMSCRVRSQGTLGLSFGKQEAKTGWNAQPTCAVNLDSVRVPAECLLGQEGQGFSIAMNACEPCQCTSSWKKGMHSAWVYHQIREPLIIYIQFSIAS